MRPHRVDGDAYAVAVLVDGTEASARQTGTMWFTVTGSRINWIFNPDEMQVGHSSTFVLTRAARNEVRVAMRMADGDTELGWLPVFGTFRAGDLIHADWVAQYESMS